MNCCKIYLKIETGSKASTLWNMIPPCASQVYVMMGREKAWTNKWTHHRGTNKLTLFWRIKVSYGSAFDWVKYQINVCKVSYFAFPIHSIDLLSSWVTMCPSGMFTTHSSRRFAHMQLIKVVFPMLDEHWVFDFCLCGGFLWWLTVLPYSHLSCSQEPPGIIFQCASGSSCDKLPCLSKHLKRCSN